MLDLKQFDLGISGPFHAENGSIKAFSHGKQYTVATIHCTKFTPQGRRAIAETLSKYPDILELCRKQQAEIERFRKMVVTWVDGDLDVDLDSRQLLAIEALYKDSGVYIR